MLIKIVMTFFILALPSCYEGWEYENGAGPGLPNIPDAEDKPINYILFHPITPANDAFDDAACGLNANYKDYRVNEWNERITSITTALQKVTDTLVVKPIVINASDCDFMNSIFFAAVSLDPWDGDTEPTQDEKGRRNIQIRASFWDGDASLVVPGVAEYGIWTAWQTLESGGQNIESLTYFILSNQNSGYFSSWRDNSSNSSVTRHTSGTPIEQPDPTPSGLGARAEVVASDTNTFISWVVSGTSESGDF